ncbi:malonyl-CoA decarboxylase [Cobetia amphilecti]|uniref:malonyl-CoA decarboxylase n=1 Tax=Cobetia amphilecti TaxID=1055104 RepID=UPI001AE05961|nr:malonyl-CoA decarboxylase [Cobetia amphilecti]
MNLSFLQDLLTHVGQRARQQVGLSPGAGNEDTALARLTESCHNLAESSGEASRIMMAQRALEDYQQLEHEQRLAFFHVLAEHYAADEARIHEAYAAYRESPDNANLSTLFAASEPRRQSLLRRLNLCPGGTYEIVRMRADLLKLIKQHPELKPLDADFAHLFASWFNRGFLMLEAIDWNTPAAVLEKIIRYEAVHAIQDWSDLRGRLDPEDRRCYAFFHPAIGDEPLIFVEVALCKGVPNNIQHLLANSGQTTEREADTAVFYSISNCQKGLKGISFGNFLIKQVVQELQRELPNLSRFVTLSPVPGFSQWLERARDEEDLEVSDLLAHHLQHDDWMNDEEAQQKMAPELRALAAHYLVNVKHRSGQPMDPVARFHLGNGASLHRLNWPGDTSPNGRQQAHGLMVNYLYEPHRIEQNHEAFSRNDSVVCSSEVKKESKANKELAKAPKREAKKESDSLSSSPQSNSPLPPKATEQPPAPKSAADANDSKQAPQSLEE